MIADGNQDVEIARRASLLAGFAFPADAQTHSVLNSSGNFEAQHFLLPYPAISVTVGACFANNLAGATACRAGARDGEETLGAANLPSPMACRARRRLGAFLRAPPAALGTLIPARNLDFRLKPACSLGKINRQVVTQVGAALRPAAPASAAEDISKPEEVTEDVGEIRKDGGVEIRTVAAGIAHAGVPESVVHGALLRIGEDAIRLADLLEFLLGSVGVGGVTIRMVLQGELPVGALQLLLARAASDTKDFIIITLLSQWMLSDLQTATRCFMSTIPPDASYF